MHSVWRTCGHGHRPDPGSKLHTSVRSHESSGLNCRRLIGLLALSLVSSIGLLWAFDSVLRPLDSLWRAGAASGVTTAVTGLIWWRDAHRCARLWRSSRSEILGQLLNAVPEGVIGVDGQGRIALVNGHAATLLGYSADQLVGQPVELLVPDAARATHVAKRQGFQDSPSERDMGSGRKLSARRRNGTDLPVDISLNAVRCDAETLTLAFLRDMTEQRALWAELSDAKARVESELDVRRRLDRRRSITSAMIQLLQASRGPDEAREILGRHLAVLFPEASGAVYLFSSSRDDAEPLTAWGQSAPEWLPFPLDACWALRLGRMHRSFDAADAMPCHHVTTGVGDTMCIPLLADNETLGVFHLRKPVTNPRTGEDLASGPDSVFERATEVAGHLALALANLRLRETLRNQSIRDPLTGLFNRRYLEESLPRELKRAERHNTPVSAIFLDLDHFKRLNDAFGHEVGDAILREFGQLVSRHVRGEDIACRYGGEEFVFVLVGATAETARARAEALRVACAGLSVDNRVGGRASTTFSAGIAASAGQTIDGRALFRAADTALYQAKADGRDRIVVAFQPSNEHAETPAGGVLVETA